MSNPTVHALRLDVGGHKAYFELVFDGGDQSVELTFVDEVLKASIMEAAVALHETEAFEVPVYRLGELIPFGHVRKGAR